MIYKKQDFNNCTFNPLCDGKILQVFPALSEIILPDWIDENTDSICRYAIMVYDPKSPLVTNERDLNYRKQIAAEIAGLTDEVVTNSVFMSTHDYAPELIFRYLMRFAKSKEWAAICAFEFAFWESIKKVTEPISGKSNKEQLEAVQKKAAIKDEIEKDINRLNVLQRIFFGEDEELKSRRRITPELVASR